jgi:hypothetical protein
MTQAFNLALFANNLNSSGKLDATAGLVNAVPVANGGTAVTATPANGQLLIGNGTNYTLATLTAGTGINIGNTAGAITITNSQPNAVVDVQTFNSTATWTKPTGGQTMARIQLWGAGGGAGKLYTGDAQPGGGGAYTELIVPLSYLASSTTVTVGAGGAAATANSTNGGNGGTSNISLTTSLNNKSTWYGYGGGGGSNSGAGGAGGGSLSAAVLNIPGNGASPMDKGDLQGGAGVYTGGGAGAPNGLGSGSVWGGGGGSGGTFSVGGTSIYGGSGGSNASLNGVAPGGGGGAPSAAGTGGNGAAGRVVITCW